MERFPKMRRKDREASKQKAFEILSSAVYGTLSTFNGDYPYGVPVNYVFCDDFIYIHSALEGHKLENIKKFPNVCFTVVKYCKVLPDELSTAYESVIVFGKAHIVESEQEKREALEKIGIKY
ncbi:MAG: pyridoxamine 5'-phosphate oxidase family protein, partial [Fervidobacterium sp.]